MPLSINFELSDRDLEHFNAAIKAASASAGNKGTDEVVAAAHRRVESRSHIGKVVLTVG